MPNLEPIENTELTEYAIKLLKKRFINTAEELLAEDHAELVKILNIKDLAVIEIKKVLRLKHPLKKYKLKDLYRNTTRNNAGRHQTGISSLDELLEAHDVFFENGAIWEVCGLPGVGKTQFCKSVALNFATMYTDNNEVLFIDTKADFSSSRIRQMLHSRSVEVSKSGHLMKLIKVERCFDMKSVLTILEQLLLQKKSNAAAVNGIKMVVIDSVAAVCLQFNNEEQRLLEARHSEAEELNDAAEPVENIVIGTQTICSLRPALGRYWSTIPNIRLSIEDPAEGNEKIYVRHIKVIKSNYCPTGIAAHVQLTNSGFVSYINA